MSPTRPAVAAAATSASGGNSLPIILGPRNLASAAMLVLLSGGIGLSTFYRLPDLARAVLIAATRCTIQLYWMGGFLLSHMFVLANTRPWLVGLWMTVAGVLAGREAAARVDYIYPKLTRHLILSLSTSVGMVMMAAARLGVLGPIQPWFSPRTWLPISGMLFGNALTATGLAVGEWTRALADGTRRSPVEWRLARGATWQEALRGAIRQSIMTALTPSLNMLTVTGIIHLPGMLTGQVLAGQPPYQAAAYQIMIFFLIAATVTTSVQIMMQLAMKETIDKSNDRIVPVESFTAVTRQKNKAPSVRQSKDKKHQFLGVDKLLRMRSWLLSATTSILPRKQRSADVLNGDKINGVELTEGKLPTMTRSVVMDRPSWQIAGSEDSASILCLNKMMVERTNFQISLDMKRGDRIGLIGPSGIGKTQVLRTLAGLENLDRNSVSVHGTCANNLTLPTWRRHVALVPQDRPALEESPRQSYKEALNYASQQRYLIDCNGRPHSVNGVETVDPADISKDWGMDPSLLDQPWSKLSGGEAQRASLAIALALKPNVLLLDESTSAMDEATALRVEKTLRESEIPVIMVSHSRAQTERFCNRMVDLELSEMIPRV